MNMQKVAFALGFVYHQFRSPYPTREGIKAAKRCSPGRGRGVRGSRTKCVRAARGLNFDSTSGAALRQNVHRKYQIGRFHGRARRRLEERAAVNAPAASRAGIRGPYNVQCVGSGHGRYSNSNRPFGRKVTRINVLLWSANFARLFG
ncbi:hypothetical protein EVAR_7082_1 [Eumeta japonica]|uniref:Uncharacterized protein n=1 Tax=Eumeta variegata TaxID=151549 RepID=A0A4C1YAN6_EUMVA|nr:hypothetical protein EVAR_7082_1 [Eumeta japonica]